jgi:hypothetical protein
MELWIKIKRKFENIRPEGGMLKKLKGINMNWKELV